MSFTNLNKKELLFAAEFASVDVNDSNTKLEIIAALEEAGFSWSNYKKFIQAEDRIPGRSIQVPDEEFKQQAAQTVQFNDMVLLKMERQNPTYDILGHRFTKSQPFQVLTADEAQTIIDAAQAEGGGFRIATPAEAKAYFG